MSKLRSHAHSLLQLLDAELARALHGAVERLGRALGPFPAHVVALGGEPDGYAGIGREVHYERLLNSEWLLAEAAPDEFLRRAAEGEHSFLALARSDRRARGLCLVELDTGPETLGLPRIAMLALLVALEQRAQAAGAELRWSVLGAAQEPVSGISSRRAVEAFLEARRATEAAPSDLAPRDPAATERWVVGSPHWARLAMREAHTVALHERWGTQCVEVTLQRLGAGLRSIALKMPAAAACVRLLRDPFGPERRAEVRVMGRLSLCNRGHRLLSASPRGLVSAYCIPAHAGAAPGRTRTFRPPPGERLLACAFTDRLIAITATPEELHLYNVRTMYASGRRAGTSVLTIQAPDTASMLTEHPLAPCLILNGKNQHIVAWVQLTRGSLLLGRRAQTKAHVMDERLLAGLHGSRANQAVWLAQRGDLVELMAQVPGEAEWRSVARHAMSAPDAIHFFCPRQSATVFDGWLGLRNDDRVLVSTIPAPGQRARVQELIVPQRATCVGITITERDEPALVVLEAGGRSFVSLSRRGAERVLLAESPVEHAELCPHTRTLLFASHTTWTLFDLAREHVLWTGQRTPEEA